MIGFCPLASGSRGNSYLLSTPHCKVLIDAGISGRAIKARLEELDVKVEDLDAILITHEHTDHVQALKVLSLKLGIPIFCNHDTAKAIIEYLSDTPKFKIFSSNETFEFEDLVVSPFSIPHDATDPVAFSIQVQSCDLKVGICTDLGFYHQHIEDNLKLSDYLVLESNHDPSMVHACNRPYVYKQRVLSRTGHLSNEECGKLLNSLMHPKLKHVFLAHLSSECNNPEKALLTAERAIGHHLDMKPKITIAFQDRNSEAIIFNEKKLKA
ncbi:Putative metallo-hydrolase YycJ [Chlamydiales bacterium SCGC AB-751-O23]|jgi:phosphoribosyl 1,2-cyclic phosphodiesterase|nr:Putative metallo-hydrolase YycJ [Chlamydiales bacterium SCGC AB-751-O23]